MSSEIPTQFKNKAEKLDFIKEEIAESARLNLQRAQNITLITSLVKYDTPFLVSSSTNKKTIEDLNQNEEQCQLFLREIIENSGNKEFTYSVRDALNKILPPKKIKEDKKEKKPEDKIIIEKNIIPKQNNIQETQLKNNEKEQSKDIQKTKENKNIKTNVKPNVKTTQNQITSKNFKIDTNKTEIEKQKQRDKLEAAQLAYYNSLKKNENELLAKNIKEADDRKAEEERKAKERRDKLLNDIKEQIELDKERKEAERIKNKEEDLQYIDDFKKKLKMLEENIFYQYEENHIKALSALHESNFKEEERKLKREIEEKEKEKAKISKLNSFVNEYLKDQKKFYEMQRSLWDKKKTEKSEENAKLREKLQDKNMKTKNMIEQLTKDIQNYRLANDHLMSVASELNYTNFNTIHGPDVKLPTIEKVPEQVDPNNKENAGGQGSA